MKNYISGCLAALVLALSFLTTNAQSQTPSAAPSDTAVMKHALAALLGINRTLDYEKAKGNA
ncbi:hypothetical protein [Geofilum rubicundum]|uniref:hypothetical protein n=1 Tax=Geofilum rubicundum TaxID=472113 RepID=UPI000780A354|nr:hypothetical protein [Geofilum rubicundum]